MSNKELYVVMLLVAAAFFSSLMFWISRQVRMINAARAAISRSRHPTDGLGVNGVRTDRSFRKRRSRCFLYLLLFLGLLFVDFQSPYHLRCGEQLPAHLGLITEVCVLAIPFLLIVRYQWTYRVCVFADHMRIRSFRTQTLRFDKMRDLSIPDARGTYCIIEMKDGKTVAVPGDLVDFLGFVELLAKKIHATD